jgi:uncharacterized membrane protein (TIGR01666 family)
MNYIKEYQRFVNSYNFAFAVRVTVGVTLPAVVFSYFGFLSIGLVASLGAMTVSNADIPGPMHRRFNGMAATMILNFSIALLVGFVSTHSVLLMIVIAILCFLLTIIGVYGSRINTIGFAGLMIMVLSLDAERSGIQILYNGLYLLVGSVWYMLLSLALFRIRPYRIIQQALGEYIYAIGNYLRTRSFFYDENVDYDRTFKNMMEQEQSIHQTQEMLREMIFKSRSITRQSTTTSRSVLIMLIETIDLFEKATGTVYNYESMHRRFDGSGILQKFRNYILKMSGELHQIGLSVQRVQPSKVSKNLNDSLRILKTDFELFVASHQNPENIEPLINMRKIIQSLEDMTIRIYTLHHYTYYDKKKIKDYKLAESYDDFVPTTNLNKQLLIQNLSIKSATFRHALRISIATTIGYLTALMLNLGHSYWVLLTILVILKPSYSLTKTRNYNRLAGTIAGAFIGVGLSYIISDNDVLLLAALVILMLLSYSFIRTKYFTGVMFMTAYLLIFFFMLSPKNFLHLLENRVLDTAIGSVIAFIMAHILAPSWEKDQIKNYMQQALEKSKKYFEIVAASFTHLPPSDLDYRLSRKAAFVAQANLSGGFTRMMNEPKRKQHNIKKLHQFTVLINVLNSHIVTLADFAQKYAAKYSSRELKTITHEIAEELAESKNIIAQKNVIETEKHAAEELKDDIQELVKQRRHEMQRGLKDSKIKTTLHEYKPIVDQFLFISRIAADVKKLVAESYGNEG